MAGKFWWIYTVCAPANRLFYGIKYQVGWVFRDKITLLSLTRYVIDQILSTIKRSRDRWQTALESVKAHFKIDDLPTKQVNSLKAYFEGNHVSVNLPTGYGNSQLLSSTVFQLAPMLCKTNRVV